MALWLSHTPWRRAGCGRYTPRQRNRKMQQRLCRVTRSTTLRSAPPAPSTPCHAHLYIKCALVAQRRMRCARARLCQRYLDGRPRPLCLSPFLLRRPRNGAKHGGGTGAEVGVSQRCTSTAHAALQHDAPAWAERCALSGADGSHDPADPPSCKPGLEHRTGHATRPCMQHPQARPAVLDTSSSRPNAQNQATHMCSACAGLTFALPM